MTVPSADLPVYRGKQVHAFFAKLESRRTSAPDRVREVVRDILENVRRNGDRALAEYTRAFDRAVIRPQGIRIKRADLKRAFQSVPEGLRLILREAAANIRRFHEREKPSSWLAWEADGVVLGQRVTALDRIGIYVPGGRAAYPSSLLMAAVPAQVAGVGEIALVSPPDATGRVHPSVLAAAYVLGLDEIYGVGGAQAVGALAFGTKTIRSVDKIVGPGNVYVAEAKRQVFGRVAIDMVAGPSEVVVLADETANPAFIAADLLAQSEHDPVACSVCVTHAPALVDRIRSALRMQARRLKRAAVVRESLSHWGGILLARSAEEAVDWANRLAPEHLGLHVANPWLWLDRIRHAGAIFLGSYSPETVGDYWAGPNHILPTNRTARFSSPLGTRDFLKHSSLIGYSERALKKHARKIISFAAMEGLDGHANAVRRRTE